MTKKTAKTTENITKSQQNPKHCQNSQQNHINFTKIHNKNHINFTKIQNKNIKITTKTS